MNKFKLSEHGYDGNSNWILRHETKTEEEFNSDCQLSIKMAIDELLKTGNYDFFIGTGEILNETYLKLISYFGYQEDVEPPTFSLRECCIIRDDDRDYLYMLNEETFQKIVEFNKKVENGEDL